jgi:hypothetical protein
VFRRVALFQVSHGCHHWLPISLHPAYRNLPSLIRTPYLTYDISLGGEQWKQLEGKTRQWSRFNTSLTWLPFLLASLPFTRLMLRCSIRSGSSPSKGDRNSVRHTPGGDPSHISRVVPQQTAYRYQLRRALNDGGVLNSTVSIPLNQQGKCSLTSWRSLLCIGV